MIAKLLAIFEALGRTIKVIGVVLISILLLSTLGGIAAYIYFAKDLPDFRAVADWKPYLVSQVFSEDGELIGEFWKEERRMLVPLSEVPPLVSAAFLAIEDARFFIHRGIDIQGTLRALVVNWKAGDIVQGGSTITQQLTRSLLLSREKSYARKAKEAILATRLERYLSKEQILELYLNQIYFGNRAWGIKAAAENYFHKELKELNLGEIAILAALPKAPEIYSPFHNPEKAAARKALVLKRLVEEHMIKPEDMELALSKPVTLFRQGVDKEENQKLAPHFLEYLRHHLLETYGEDKLYRGGLKIVTTLSPAYQQAANEALQRGLEVLDRRKNRWHGTIRHIAAGEIPAEREKIHRKLDGKETNLAPGQVYPAIVLGFEGSTTEIAIGQKTLKIPAKDLVLDPNRFYYDEGSYFSSPQNNLKIGDVIQVKIAANGSPIFYQPPKIEGALFAQEIGTGKVRAWVGGYDFSRSEFDRAVGSLRQPGSSFKPFVYAAALDKGYTFRTPLYDTPFFIPSGDQVWSPKNYDGEYRGITNVHEAIVHSYNVATARVGFHIHTDYLTAYVRKLGITAPIEKFPAMTLGANGISLHEMVRAYTVFPNGGIFQPQLAILKVTDQKGNVLEENTLLQNKNGAPEDHLALDESEKKILYGENIPAGHVITPQTAYLMTQLLGDVVKMGTGQRVSKLGIPVAGKTGTSNDTADLWFIGFTPELAAGVWVGYDEPKAIGKGEQGGRTAAPIFLDFMQGIKSKLSGKDFTMPSELMGKDLFTTAGGSAIYADPSSIPRVNWQGNASPEENAIDFQEADLEKEASKPTQH